MANSILASALLPGGDDPSNGVVVSAPVANTWYNLDFAFGIGSSDPAQAVSTVLTCAGATIDTTYGPPIRGHGVNYTGRVGIDLGWTPNGKQVHLNGLQCALGIWRILFPTAGTYTVSLSGFGTVGVTVGSGPAPTTSPTVAVLHIAPLNRQPSKLLQLTYSGTYPSGGLDLNEGQIGLTGVLFADLNDDSTYRYTWSGNKLRAWTSSGEASGTVNLSTIGLFFGMVG